MANRFCEDDLSQTHPDDPATRFYRSSHERNRPTETRSADAHAVSSRSHRYYGAIKELRGAKPKRVLELGFGNPRTVQAIAEAGTFEYVITDIVDRLEGAELPPRTSLITCNLDNSFPFSDEEFDVVIALMVVEHLYDPFHSISEVARVLRPGGLFVMNLPNIASIKCRLQLLFGRMPVTSSEDWFEKLEWDGNHLHSFTMSDVKRLCGKYRLDYVRVYPVGNFRALKRLRPSILCHEITYVFHKRG